MPKTLQFTSYAGVRAFLAGTTDYEKMVRYRMKRGLFDLGRVERFFSALGAPQTAYESVHVAGTTGKGSTVHYCDALLRAHGLRCGRYTSPHVEHETERIAVDGRDIDEAQLLDIFNEMAPVLERFQPTGDALTWFEIMTGAALLHFRRGGADTVVLETGMGGRLDATNAVTPALTVITNVGFDHTDKLGDALEDIAYEKSGIIKEGIPLITGQYEHEALDYVLERARDMHAPVRRFGQHFHARNIQRDADGMGFTFDFERPGCVWRKVHVPQAGQYQAINAAMAIEALHLLSQAGIVAHVDEAATRRGVENVRMPARCEIFAGEPPVLLDVAHNADSMRQTVRTLASLYGARSKAGPGAHGTPHGRPMTLVMALASDKDAEAIIGIMAETFEHVILTRFNSPRARDPAELKAVWRKYSAAEIEVEPDSRAAFERGLDLAGPDGVVVVTGSFYLAGEVRPLLRLRAHARREA